MKILSVKSTKIIAKGILTDISESGLVFENSEGTETLSFGVIKEHFGNSEVKLELVKVKKVEADI